MNFPMPAGQCGEAATRRHYQGSPLTSWSAQLVGTNGAYVGAASTGTGSAARLEDVINAVLDLVDLDDFAKEDGDDDNDNDASYDSFGYDPSQQHNNAQQQHDHPE